MDIRIFSIEHCSKLQCLGSAQHLKSKFGEGWTIEVRARDAPAIPADAATPVVAPAASGAVGAAAMNTEAARMLELMRTVVPGEMLVLDKAVHTMYTFTCKVGWGKAGSRTLTAHP